MAKEIKIGINLPFTQEEYEDIKKQAVKQGFTQIKAGKKVANIRQFIYHKIFNG